MGPCLLRWPQYSSLTTHPDAGVRNSDSGGLAWERQAGGWCPGPWRTILGCCTGGPSTVAGEKPEWEGRISAQGPEPTFPVRQADTREGENWQWAGQHFAGVCGLLLKTNDDDQSKTKTKPRLKREALQDAEFLLFHPAAPPGASVGSCPTSSCRGRHARPPTQTPAIQRTGATTPPASEVWSQKTLPGPKQAALAQVAGSGVRGSGVGAGGITGCSQEAARSGGWGGYLQQLPGDAAERIYLPVVPFLLLFLFSLLRDGASAVRSHTNTRGDREMLEATSPGPVVVAEGRVQTPLRPQRLCSLISFITSWPSLLWGP